MSAFILSPPVAFLIILAATIILSLLLSRLSFRSKTGESDASKKAYACGEDVAENRVQVDYSQFFVFAFFFTILHVLALMVATVPTGNENAFLIAFLYVVGAVTGLMILFRR